jgi:hypothetical protein
MATYQLQYILSTAQWSNKGLIVDENFEQTL